MKNKQTNKQTKKNKSPISLKVSSFNKKVERERERD